MILGKMIQTIKPGGLIMFEVYSKTNKLWYWWIKDVDMLYDQLISLLGVKNIR